MPNKKRSELQELISKLVEKEYYMQRTRRNIEKGRKKAQQEKMEDIKKWGKSVPESQLNRKLVYYDVVELMVDKYAERDKKILDKLNQEIEAMQQEIDDTENEMENSSATLPGTPPPRKSRAQSALVMELLESDSDDDDDDDEEEGEIFDLEEIEPEPEKPARTLIF